MCNRHVTDLAGRAAEPTAAGVRVLLVVPEGRAETGSWRAKREPPFPVVTGRRGTPQEAVGLLKKVFGTVRQSGSLLIERKGIEQAIIGLTRNETGTP
ncbi:redoxin domain-containing protein [Sciscionella marina]|uniref:redoxin domain-containing protein n=1 Tax=Sciscionella marina TaxID=508770 RepID=UPI000374B03C|nr:redoxin domain-containing protein [Sciscionella marina]